MYDIYKYNNNSIINNKNINYLNYDKYIKYLDFNSVDTILDMFSSNQLVQIRNFVINGDTMDLSSFDINQLKALRILFTKYKIQIPNNVSAFNDNNIINQIKPIRTVSNINVKPQSAKTTEEERREQKEEIKNALLNRYFNDICNTQGSEYFRGWILPNGKLLSQYNESEDGVRDRQDHTRLVVLFMNGLELYNPDKYNELKQLYDQYVLSSKASDSFESFAVERLGWVQLSIFGRKKLIYRGERWQDKLIRPYLVDYGFNYEIYDNGECYLLEFEALYDNIEDIIKLGLEKRIELKLDAS